MTHTVRPLGTRPRNNRKRRARPSDRLRTLSRHVARHPRRTVAQLVALGRLLAEAKQLVGHGRFTRWFASTGAPYSMRAGREAMTAARRLDKLPLPLGRFSVSAVKILARRKVARNPALVDALAELVRSPGPVVAFSRAREAVSRESPDVIYPRGGARTELESPAEALARRLADLVYHERAESVLIVPNHDPETPSVTVTMLGLGRRSVTRSYLTTAFAAATGEEELRKCPHPSHQGDNPIPPYMYNRGGFFCKVCDRKRVREHDQKRKAEREARKAAAANDSSPAGPPAPAAPAAPPAESPSPAGPAV